MSKKKFKETKVGSFITKNFPKIAGTIGDALPDSGVLGIVKNLVSKDDVVPQEVKNKALEMIHQFEIEEAKEITKRWESDMASDNKLSKSVRPLTMMFLTLFLTVLIFVDSADGIGFKVDSAYIDLLKGLLMLVYFAYFGGRTAEKWKKLNK